MVRAFKGLSGILDTSASTTGFWMLYGTPKVNGAPFIWSQSSWKWQKLRDVPDRVDGQIYPDAAVPSIIAVSTEREVVFLRSSCAYGRLLTARYRSSTALSWLKVYGLVR